MRKRLTRIAAFTINSCPWLPIPTSLVERITSVDYEYALEEGNRKGQIVDLRRADRDGVLLDHGVAVNMLSFLETSKTVGAAPNAMVFALGKLVLSVEAERDDLPDEIVGLADEARAVCDEWGVTLPRLEAN